MTKLNVEKCKLAISIWVSLAQFARFKYGNRIRDGALRKRLWEFKSQSKTELKTIGMQFSQSNEIYFNHYENSVVCAATMILNIFDLYGSCISSECSTWWNAMNEQSAVSLCPFRIHLSLPNTIYSTEMDGQWIRTHEIWIFILNLNHRHS